MVTSVTNHPDQKPRESDIWGVLDRIPGTNSRQTLDFIYQRTRSLGGIVVLSRPSARIAVSAVLGALASGSNIGPVRVYVADADLRRLIALFGELSKLDLACEVTLYHGSLIQFFRDLPLSADVICTDVSDLGLRGSIRSTLSEGTVILCPNDANVAPTPDLIASGFLEIESIGEGGTAYRASNRCVAPRFIPRAGIRVKLQGKLHDRYFLPNAARGASHTPVADLTEDIRREFTRQFPAASGTGSWPYAAPNCHSLPPTLPSGKPWPRISIVTPTRNQGRYLEETILSVLHQNYPSIEHIIIDGASTDDTASILGRYRSKLAFVVSEPDRGQSHAINKGMSRASGEILTWLNGDDMLAPGALAAIALAFDVNDADMVAGVCQLYRDGFLESQHLTACADGPLPLEELLDLDRGWHAGRFFVQPEVMFTKEIWLRAGGQVDERLSYTMDYELWLRLALAGARLHVIGRPVARFRLHEEQKISLRSNVAAELTAARDEFVREYNVDSKRAVSALACRERLRVTLVSDNVSFCNSGLARALALAGHEVSVVDSPERLVDRVAATRPDLVILGRMRNANADPLLLSKHFPTSLIADGAASLSPYTAIPINFRSDVFRPRDRRSCREQLGLSLDSFLVLFADSANKGRVLLDALARLELPNVSLITIGAPSEDVDGSIKIISMDNIKEPHRAALIYSAVDVVAAPASGEVAEQALIEAIACGTPAVGCPLGTIPATVRDGVTGVLATDSATESLAAAIHYLYIHSKLRNDVAQWGRIFAENEWTEFSVYRLLFIGLVKSGLTRSLNLHCGIKFLPIAPEPHQFSNVERTVKSTEFRPDV